MKVFTCKKGTGTYYIMFLLLIVDFLVLLLTNYIDVYVILSLIRVSLVVLNIYGIYYLLLSITLNYAVDEEKVLITGNFGFKKVIIPFNEIEGYKTSAESINGLRLSGIGNHSFAIGRYVLHKIGTTRLFVTSSKSVIFIKTKDINYAISPNDLERFTQKLKEHNIHSLQWEYSNRNEVHLHKDKKFMIPFIIVSIIIFLLTIIPLIMYVKNLIPNEMPLSFNASFQPAKIGNAKQYAFKQMIYGVLNMAILFCMYYAAHFHAKYDRKSANVYIYASLMISMVFFLMQLETIFKYIL